VEEIILELEIGKEHRLNTRQSLCRVNHEFEARAHDTGDTVKRGRTLRHVLTIFDRQLDQQGRLDHEIKAIVIVSCFKLFR